MLPKAQLFRVTLEGDKHFEEQIARLNFDWILGVLRVMAETPETHEELKRILETILHEENHE